MMVTDHDSFEWCAFDRGGGPSESYGGTVPEIILVTVRHQQNGPPPKYVVLPDRLAKFYSVFVKKGSFRVSIVAVRSVNVGAAL